MTTINTVAAINWNRLFTNDITEVICSFLPLIEQIKVSRVNKLFFSVMQQIQPEELKDRSNPLLTSFLQILRPGIDRYISNPSTTRTFPWLKLIVYDDCERKKRIVRAEPLDKKSDAGKQITTYFRPEILPLTHPLMAPSFTCHIPYDSGEQFLKIRDEEIVRALLKKSCYQVVPTANTGIVTQQEKYIPKEHDFISLIMNQTVVAYSPLISENRAHIFMSNLVTTREFCEGNSALLQKLTADEINILGQLWDKAHLASQKALLYASQYAQNIEGHSICLASIKRATGHFAKIQTILLSSILRGKQSTGANLLINEYQSKFSAYETYILGTSSASEFINLVNTLLEQEV